MNTMKKLIICTLFSLAFVFLFSSTALADIIPPNSHLLNRCVKVVNLNEFPDVVLIGYYTGPMINKYESYQIKNNGCLTKGYKFNSLSVYWNTKDKPNSIDPNNLLLKNVEPDGGYVGQNNPLVKEDTEYSIAGFSGGKPVLYKSKQTSEYNNGTPKKVETFSNPLGSKGPNKITPTPTPLPKITPTPSNQPKITPSPSPESAKRGFRQSIVCFFRGWLGKSCQ